MGQELYHLVIRCRNARIWNYQHSDCWAVIRALTAVTKRLQGKYDKYKHAAVLGDDKFDPVSLFKKLNGILDNDYYFNLIQSTIFAYLQLQGTRDPKLRAELNSKLCRVIITPDRKKQTARQFVSDLLCVLYKKVTKNHIGQIEGLFLFGKDKFLNPELHYEDWFYKNQYEKDNQHEPFKQDVPFYTSNPYIHERLLLLASTPLNHSLGKNQNRVLRLKDYPLNNNTPYVSYIAGNADWESQFQLYQETKHSIHAHPLQKHKNGKLVNNKRGGINQSHAAYKQRNLWWTRKHVLARGQASECNPLALHHGSNGLENIHNIVIKYAPHFQNQPVYWHMIPAWQIMIKFGVNYRALKSLIKDYIKKSQKYENCNFDHNELDSLLILQRDALGINKLRDLILDETNHGYLWFDKTERDEEKLFNGIKPSQCKGKISRIKQKDSEELLMTLLKFDCQTFDKTGELINWQNAICNEEFIQNVYKQTDARMNTDEIITFIKSEFICCDVRQDEKEQSMSNATQNNEIGGTFDANNSLLS